MKCVRLVIAISAIIAVLFIVPHLKAQWKFLPDVRVTLPDQGYGQLINDLESHTSSGHPMRNEADPGNWAHELTHQINCDIRNRTHEQDNAFYVLKGVYMLLATPNITLKQVADEVPKLSRKSLYPLYLVEAQKWWNTQPLYVLDEATAYATGLQYHVESGEKDEYRFDGAYQFIAYSRAVVRAVEKHDPEYKDMKLLKQFVEWHITRVKKLMERYIGPPYPPQPSPDSYHFYKEEE